MSNSNVAKLFQENEAMELAKLMLKKHELFLDQRSFDIFAHQEDDFAIVKVVLSNADNSFYYPVEARVDYHKEGLGLKEAFEFLIDYIDLYFEDYLSDAEELFLPIDWAEFEYDAIKFQMRGQVRNLDLEQMADRILEENVVST